MSRIFNIKNWPVDALLDEMTKCDASTVSEIQTELLRRGFKSDEIKKMPVATSGGDFVSHRSSAGDNYFGTLFVFGFFIFVIWQAVAWVKRQESVSESLGKVTHEIVAPVGEQVDKFKQGYKK